MEGRGHVKIVLPCANEGEWVRLTVDSILENTDYPSFEIVISANGDDLTDFSFLDEPRYRGRVRVHATKEFLGVGGSCNVAVLPGDARFYLFLDAHCLVERKDWLQRAVDCLEAHPNASMMQPEVLSFIYEPEPKPGEPLDPRRIRRGYFEYGTRWAWPYDQPWRVVETIGYRKSPTVFEAMSGAGMAVFAYADTFHRLGGFESEVIGWFHETMDYCVRAGMRGRPMLLDPTWCVLHRVKTEKPTYPRHYHHMIHGNLLTAYKYLSPRRRDLAESLFRKHGYDAVVDHALRMIHQGRWLEERVRHLSEQVHDDDWLFKKFGVYEERFVGG